MQDKNKIRIYTLALANLIGLNIAGFGYILLVGAPSPDGFDLFPADILILGGIAVIVSSLLGWLIAVLIIIIKSKKRQLQMEKTYRLSNALLVFLILLLFLVGSILVHWSIGYDMRFDRFVTST